MWIHIQPTSYTDWHHFIILPKNIIKNLLSFTDFQKTLHKVTRLRYREKFTKGLLSITCHVMSCDSLQQQLPPASSSCHVILLAKELTCHYVPGRTYTVFLSTSTCLYATLNFVFKEIIKKHNKNTQNRNKEHLK